MNISEVVKKVARKKLSLNEAFKYDDYIKIQKENPDDLKEYVMENYPEIKVQPSRFVAWLLNTYDKDRLRHIEKFKPIAHKIKAWLGERILKQNLSTKNYKILDL